MLRGTHNGQATAERERKLKLGRYVVTLSVENHETYPEDHERHCSRPRFNIAQAFNKAWPQRGEEKGRQNEGGGLAWSKWAQNLGARETN